MNLFLCALGAYFGTQLVKTLSPWRVPPGMKIFLALAGALGAAALLDKRASALVVLGFAGAGLSVLFHRLGRVVMLLGDWVTITIMRSRRR